jgi:hypothetical protein
VAAITPAQERAGHAAPSTPAQTLGVCWNQARKVLSPVAALLIDTMRQQPYENASIGPLGDAQAPNTNVILHNALERACQLFWKMNFRGGGKSLATSPPRTSETGVGIGLTLTDGTSTTTQFSTITCGGIQVLPNGQSNPATLTVGPSVVQLQRSYSYLSTGPQNLSSILGRTWHVDDFGAHGDGVTDDSAAFNSALLALGQAGGGRLLIHPEKAYLCTGSQIVIGYHPNGAFFNNIWLDCERPLGGASPSNTSAPEATGGIIILAPGNPESGAGGPPNTYMNPERTTMALSIAGDNCKVSNIVFVAESFWASGAWSFPGDICTMQSYIFGQAPIRAITLQGNGVQIDGQWAVVENCVFYGFNFGVVHVPTLVTGPAAPYTYYNNAPASPLVRNILGDCWNLLRFGTTGNAMHTTSHIKVLPLLAPGGVPTGPYNPNKSNSTGFSVLAPAADNASGCYLVIAEMNGVAVNWSPEPDGGWSTSGIGTPTAGNEITVSLYDNAEQPVVHTVQSPQANRFTGYWELYSKYDGGAGYVIHLPSTSPLAKYWQYWGLQSSGGDVSPGPNGTQVPSVPAGQIWGSIAFSALTRRGAGIFLNQVHSRKFSDIFLLNNGFCLAGCEDITVTDFTADGSGSDISANADIFYTTSFPTAAYFYLDEGTKSFTACTGHIISWAASLINTASGQPGSTVNIIGTHMGSTPLSVFQNGNPLNVVGGFIGSLELGVGSLSLGAGLTAATFPTTSQDGNTLTIMTSANTSIWIDPSCTNLPAPMLGSSAAALVQYAAPYLPTSPGMSPKHIYINQSTGVLTYG